MNQEIVIATGAIFGFLSVMLGAFGAHALKKILRTDKQKSFETGVKYQMYHAIVLVIIGFNMHDVNIYTYLSFTLGTLLFSFSIYLLVLSESKGKKIRFLGPITPLGGLLLLTGWLLLFIDYVSF